MASLVFELRSYTVYHFGKDTARFSDIATVRVRSYIICFGDVHRLVLAFANNGTHLPDAHYDPASQSGHLYFHLEQLAHLVDLLRHEQPIYGVINPETGFVGLQTGPEPVGEHERPEALRA